MECGKFDAGKLVESCTMTIELIEGNSALPEFASTATLLFPVTSRFFEGPLDSQRRPHGIGLMRNSDGDVVERGSWVHGQLHGQTWALFGTRRMLAHEGDYVRGQRKGLIVVADGAQILKCGRIEQERITQCPVPTSKFPLTLAAVVAEFPVLAGATMVYPGFKFFIGPLDAQHRRSGAGEMRSATTGELLERGVWVADELQADDPEGAAASAAPPSMLSASASPAVAPGGSAASSNSSADTLLSSSEATAHVTEARPTAALPASSPLLASDCYYGSRDKQGRRSGIGVQYATADGCLRLTQCGLFAHDILIESKSIRCTLLPADTPLPVADASMLYPDGRAYVGPLSKRSNLPHTASGEVGMMHAPDGRLVFRGEFAAGEATNGVRHDSKEGTFEGRFDEDLLSGIGTHTSLDGTIRAGQFDEAKLHGQGVVYSPEGRMIQCGNFERGKLVFSGAVLCSRLPAKAPLPEWGQFMRAAAACARPWSLLCCYVSELTRVPCPARAAVQHATLLESDGSSYHGSLDSKFVPHGRGRVLSPAGVERARGTYAHAALHGMCAQFLELDGRSILDFEGEFVQHVTEGFGIVWQGGKIVTWGRWKDDELESECPVPLSKCPLTLAALVERCPAVAGATLLCTSGIVFIGPLDGQHRRHGAGEMRSTTTGVLLQRGTWIANKLQADEPEGADASAASASSSVAAESAAAPVEHVAASVSSAPSAARAGAPSPHAASKGAPHQVKQQQRHVAAQAILPSAAAASPTLPAEHAARSSASATPARKAAAPRTESAPAASDECLAGSSASEQHKAADPTSSAASLPRAAAASEPPAAGDPAAAPASGSSAGSEPAAASPLSDPEAEWSVAGAGSRARKSRALANAPSRAAPTPARSRSGAPRKPASSSSAVTLPLRPPSGAGSASSSSASAESPLRLPAQGDASSAAASSKATPAAVSSALAAPHSGDAAPSAASASSRAGPAPVPAASSVAAAFAAADAAHVAMKNAALSMPEPVRVAASAEPLAAAASATGNKRARQAAKRAAVEAAGGGASGASSTASSSIDRPFCTPSPVAELEPPSSAAAAPPPPVDGGSGSAPALSAVDSALEAALTCSVCLDLFSRPMTFPCMHSCCALCIRRMRLTHCPECRSAFVSASRNAMADTLVQLHVQRLFAPEQRAAYQARVASDLAELAEMDRAAAEAAGSSS